MTQTNTSIVVSELHEKLMNKETYDPISTCVWVDFDNLNEIKSKEYTSLDIETNQDHDLSKKSLMYLQSSMDKDERMFKLENGINKGDINTISDAKELLNVEQGTIVSYLKEMDKSLLDESGKEVGSTKEYKLNESKQFGKHLKFQSKSLRPQFRYFDGDPEKGGKEITKAEHIQRIKEFKNQKLQILENKRDNL